MKTVADYVRTIPDFPERGVMFRDITTILQDADGLQLAVAGLREELKGLDYDVVVGPESRGFIFGVPVAYAEHKAFVPIRKKGKLPAETISEEYALEYGTATIEIHRDAIRPHCDRWNDRGDDTIGGASRRRSGEDTLCAGAEGT